MNSKDSLTKRERIERTFAFEPVDRVAVHDFIYNRDVHALYADGGQGDMHQTVRAALDLWRPMDAISSIGSGEGFEAEYDGEWTSWVKRRPFEDTAGLKEYIARDIDHIRKRTAAFDGAQARDAHRSALLGHIHGVGDDTVMMELDNTPLRDCLWRAGIELFSFLLHEDPDVIRDWLDAYLDHQLLVTDALADRELSPVVLVANEICSSAAPLLGPEMLDRFLFADIAPITEAWHRHGVKTIMEIQGNSRDLVPHFIANGADGFYAIEAIANMDIVELKNQYPQSIWIGGVDGANLMTFDTAEQVADEVRREIVETDALNTGGLVIASSSEINPPIPSENFKAMVDAAWCLRNRQSAAGDP